MEASNSSFCSMLKFKPWIKYTLFGVVILIVILLISCLVYNVNISKVSNSAEAKEIIVNAGSSYLTIASTLKNNDLIKSELFYKIYIKTHNIKPLQAGKYILSENMNVKQIVNVLSGGSTYNPDVITITFKEGINMRKIVSLISANTSNTEEDIYNTLKDQDYLDELINNYWFLSDNIKSNKIYYSLEGYLFPNTYQFKNKDVTIKEIFKAMLDNMATKLEPFKEDISKNNYSIHQLITLASIVELEAANSDDRAGVAGVFYNRLESGWSLGSDVTTYYAEKVDMSERDLYQRELDNVNDYNTRSSSMAGKLPIGPICIPGIESIKATIYPSEHDYYYFVADKNKRTYFNTTNSGHIQTIAKLKDENLWYEY